MEGISKIKKVGHMTPRWPLWPNFAFSR